VIIKPESETTMSGVVAGPLMGATDFRDLVGLGLRSPRSSEGHTTGLIDHTN